ncbi:MAG: hypothetical protein A2147_00910 [Chloroflexi bacterium RBG_16_57_8]|nr:MAG: hypothetical protein A2147_00910 [Chloroflexi bacterium RBG_16_57_8]
MGLRASIDEAIVLFDVEECQVCAFSRFAAEMDTACGLSHKWKRRKARKQGRLRYGVALAAFTPVAQASVLVFTFLVVSPNHEIGIMPCPEDDTPRVRPFKFSFGAQMAGSVQRPTKRALMSEPAFACSDDT